MSSRPKSKAPSLFAAAGLPAGVNDVARYSAQEVQFQLEITGVG